ncbi:MAG: DUF1292 domain-containing protein [Bacillota bacterium]
MSDYEKKIDEMVEEFTEDDVWELEAEDGELAKFYMLATIEYNKKWYVVFQPAEESEDMSEDELVIFELETNEEDEDVFLPVEDDETLNAVYDEYVKLCEEDEMLESASEEN